MILRPIQISLVPSAKPISRFVDQAKKAWPYETMAILLGHDSIRRKDRHIEIHDLYVPEDLDKHCTTNRIYLQDHWYAEAVEAAKDDGLEVVGDIHSHPYIEYEATACAPSRQDLETYHWDGLTGIVNIWMSKRGLRHFVKFWGPMPPVEFV